MGHVRKAAQAELLFHVVEQHDTGVIGFAQPDQFVIGIVVGPVEAAAAARDEDGPAGLDDEGSAQPHLLLQFDRFGLRLARDEDQRDLLADEKIDARLRRFVRIGLVVEQGRVEVGEDDVVRLLSHPLCFAWLS